MGNDYDRLPPLAQNQVTSAMAEDKFIGKWVPESKDNYDGFMKGIGMSDEVIEKDRNVVVTTEIAKAGNGFTITLVLGQECEVETMLGKKIKITCTMEGNTVTGKSDSYTSSMTVMDDGKLKEVVTVAGNTITVICKKQ